MFDKIFYINLAHRKDRDQNVINEMKKSGTYLPSLLTRVEAVNGKDLDIKNLPSNIVTDEGKKDALDKNLRVYIPLTPGGIGCALSHRKVYEKIIDENLKSALILEDDIRIDDNFSAELQIILSEVPKNYDVLFLGYHKSTIKYITQEINDYISKSDAVYGLFGYIVTNSGARKLLDVFPITEQIDSEISYNFSRINAYIVNPNKRIIFSDESSVSTEFGTDIQVREEFEPFDNYENNNYKLEYLRLALIIILLVLVIYCFH